MDQRLCNLAQPTGLLQTAFGGGGGGKEPLWQQLLVVPLQIFLTLSFSAPGLGFLFLTVKMIVDEGKTFTEWLTKFIRGQAGDYISGLSGEEKLVTKGEHHTYSCRSYPAVSDRVQPNSAAIFSMERSTDRGGDRMVVKSDVDGLNVKLDRMQWMLGVCLLLKVAVLFTLLGAGHNRNGVNVGRAANNANRQGGEDR